MVSLLRHPARGELLGFALAGGCAYAADLALFVLLRGPAGLDPLTAKSLSFTAGCAIAYAGNSLGTYRGTAARGPALRRFTVFLAVNAAGALVQLLCLAVSHYGLGLTSPRADTVSGSGVGMALATVLRFWGTRTLVFGGRGARLPESADHNSDTDCRPAGESGPGGGRRSSWTG
ncbi:GtrA family protein [Streptomyces sp. NPDC058045]|uniref:GtrA family protein n=1 Tax=Streptomyces sp. NPDC058045 TaxID=3346311 RepID=UPI0036F02F2A